MRTDESTVHPAPAMADWRRTFAAMLPQIERQLSYAFRRLPAEPRDEAIQAGLASSFVQCLQLAQQGRMSVASATSLALYAARQVRSGRCIARSINSDDPFSVYAQRRRGITRESGTMSRDGTPEWVADSIAGRQASIPDQVALRIDFPRWLSRLATKVRSIARDLAIGCSTSEVAQKHGLSAGRISQLRRELHVSWLAFQGLDISAAWN